MVNSESEVEIIEFSLELKDHIKILNLEWIKVHFKVEDKDERVLSNPQEEIIDKGGKIFYARYNGEIVGTVSLLKINDVTFELTKMAVTKKVQGLGIGKKMLEHLFIIAERERIEKLIIYSARKLKSAIHLYLKYGFTEIALEEGVYERADIKLEKIVS
jgi:ribosomal protein S18 acetylase RimI-like enzyme